MFQANYQHYLQVPRRKGNDSTKGSATHPREVDNGARETGRATSSSDQKRQYRLCIGDASTKEAKGPSDHLQSFEENASFSNNSANSGPSSSNEAYNTRQLPSLASPPSNSDDDFISDQPPVYHTLPGRNCSWRIKFCIHLYLQLHWLNGFVQWQSFIIYWFRLKFCVIHQCKFGRID